MTGRYPSPRALLQKHGLRAKRSWGQNFLGDEAILDDIARLAAPAAGELVVELGAGLGHLTARLLARGARVVAVERDRDMARVLREEMGDRIALLEADAARIDYGSIAAEHGARSTSTATPTANPTPTELSVVGNLPYHLTSPILFSLLDQVEHVGRAVFLVQREVAERLAARPGTHEWGILSVLLQREADVSIERIVPPGAFLPPPKVESAVLCALFRPPPHRVADPARFRRLVKAGFAQRRKTLANALSAARIADDAALAAAMNAAGVDPRRRGETLTIAEWTALDRALG
ncbi:MAG TPA: 16S rRNA (adenine(1518)-N(6)/adenine(1519)-N(6))-dimethyltransferase RsmA [Anaeromyxobacter sp.]|nr:16S rRNA (adenine(1518)-N(6)/adenine(1519)-N(6))-dimethyltransferase RsmA [Anaeromyxobacter sp.]